MRNPLNDTILDKAVLALTETTKLEVQKHPDGKTIDVYQQLSNDGRIVYTLQVVIEPQIPETTLVPQERKPDFQPVLVTKKLDPKTAVTLRTLGLNYIDTIGNAYITRPQLFILIQQGAVKGKRTAGDKGDARPRNRAFNATGLRMLFALLTQPGLENEPYRTIADTAGTALGAIPRMMRDLSALGFFQDRGTHGRIIINRNELLQRWAEAYPMVLRPKLVAGKYRPLTNDPNWWRTTPLANYQACWGGEPAAALLTDYLVPQQFTLYTFAEPGELGQALKLIPDKKGPVEILRAFWHPKKDQIHPQIAPPLLVYADLLTTRDPRNIETAKIIHEKHFA